MSENVVLVNAIRELTAEMRALRAAIERMNSLPTVPRKPGIEPIMMPLPGPPGPPGLNPSRGPLPFPPDPSEKIKRKVDEDII